MIKKKKSKPRPKRREYISNNIFPDLKSIKHALRWGLHGRFNYPVIGAYVIGSRARGDFNEDSDIDIGVVISPVRGKSSLKITENYHSKYHNNFEKPRFNDMIIDFQFFYPGELEYLVENENYSIIKIF